MNVLEVGHAYGFEQFKCVFVVLSVERGTSMPWPQVAADVLMLHAGRFADSEPRLRTVTLWRVREGAPMWDQAVDLGRSW